MIKLEPQVETYLEQTRIPLRLACTEPSGWPVVLSLWFLYENGRIYCATRHDARVATYLTQNPRCGFEVAGDEPPYCGVRGQGDAEIDSAIGGEVLERLLVRYLGSTSNALSQKLLAHRDTELAIVITPRSITKWNFTKRMKNSVQPASDKICP